MPTVTSAWQGPNGESRMLACGIMPLICLSFEMLLSIIFLLLSLSFYISVDVCVCGSLSLLDYLSLVALHATGWVPAVETTFRSQDNGTVCPATKMTPNTEQTLLGTVAQSLRIELERNIFSCITFVEKNIGRKRERERCFFPNIEEMSNSGRPYLCDPRKSQERCRKIRKSYTSNTYTYQG